MLSTMMLRSMKQAKYDAESTGHFGLAAEYYSHFTSPIRRYPDLVIHRVIREVLENGGALDEKRHEVLAGRMADIAQQSSERERVAVDAERDTEALKKAEFMLDKVGEEFEGIISSVTSFGMFIELENTVEGLIRLSAMTDDYYHFDEGHMALIGERTSKVYRIGDDVKVRVAKVNMDDHTIDFEMVDMKPRRQGRGEGERGGNGGRGFGARDGARGGKGRGGKRGAAEGGAPGGRRRTAPAARVAAAMPRRAGVVRAVAVKQRWSWRAAGVEFRLWLRQGGYSSASGGALGFDRNARSGGAGGKGRRKKTAGAGIFIGEGPTPGGNAGGNSGGGGGRKRKSKGGNGTAALSARRKVTFSS